LVAVLRPNRGSIYWVDFDPVRGSEEGKSRPALVIQNNVGNLTSTTTIVVCITSRLPKKRYPFHVWLPASVLGKPSVILCEQIRTVSLERFGATELAMCPEDIMGEVEQAIRVSLGFPDSV
jgi:mRNA interferase MazF